MGGDAEGMRDWDVGLYGRVRRVGTHGHSARAEAENMYLSVL